MNTQQPTDGHNPSLPTTPVPLIPETWQQVPDTAVAVSKPSVSNRLWPVIIILSAVAAGLVNFVFVDTAIRPIIVFWFLVVCPGMVLVRFLRLISFLCLEALVYGDQNSLRERCN